MKRFVRFLGVAVVAGSIVALASAGEATPLEAGAPADVVRSTGCVFFDADGLAIVDPNARVQLVVTNNGRGNATAYCQGELPAGSALPDRALHYDFGNTGFVCLAGDDWKMTVTPSGKASFTCHVPI